MDVARATGIPIRDDDVLVVAMSDYLATRAAAIAPDAGPPHAGEPEAQMTDVVARWFRSHGGRLRAIQFSDPSQPRWTRTPEAAAGCRPIGAWGQRA